LPVVALVFSILGVCLPPLLVIGVILGIVALVQKKGSLVPAIIAVVVPVAAVPVVGILAAIAIPNFIKFQSRSKQSECKANLKGAFTALKSYEMEKGAFSVHPAEVGFSPERGNRYLYAFSAGGPIAANGGAPAADAEGVGADTLRFPDVSNEALRAGIPAALRATLGVQGMCPECAVTVACAGNIDNDTTVDVWSISTGDRPGAPAGTPFNDVDDTSE
jgi:type IV pilus assembly protein PilA